MSVIEIPYLPRRWETGSSWEIHEHPARFKVIVAHRRFGKSILGFNHIQRKALQNKGRYAIVGETYKKLKSIYWKGGIVSKYLPQNATVGKHEAKGSKIFKTNKSELYIEYANGSILEFIGSDEYDSHRGAQYDYLFFDEFDDQKIEAWDTVFRYTLLEQADGTFKGGGAMFGGTLKGRKNLWSFYQRGLVDDPSWKSWMFKATETKLLSAIDVEEIRKELAGNEAIMRQELECEPMFYSGLIYPEFTQANVIEPFEVPPQWRNISFPGALDYGGTNPTAVGRYAIDNDGNIFMIGEHYKPNEIIAHNAKAIRNLFDLPEGESLNLIADPSTVAKTMQTNEIRFSVADAYREFKINLIPGENELLPGIDRVRQYLRFDPLHPHPITGKQGSPRFFLFKGRCPHTEEEFGKYIWQEPAQPGLNNPQKPVKAFDHSMDQLRYFISARQNQYPIVENPTYAIGDIARKDREDTIKEGYQWQQGEEWI